MTSVTLLRMPLSTQTLPALAFHQAVAFNPPKGFVLSNRRFLELSRCQRSFRARRSSVGFRWQNRRKEVILRSNASNSVNGAPAGGLVKKRKILEHIYLLQAKADLSEVEEKEMLDHLYTSQYQMRGIIAISLGRIADPNVDSITHAVYMRFQTKEDVEKFYNNSNFFGVLKKHVMPYCYGSVSVDYEAEVEDDILPIFRRGEEFNYGVECVLLISAFETAPRHAIEDALATLRSLILKFCSLIVQATQGSNLRLKESEYTHAAVIRFPSFEAMETFRNSSEYNDMWRLKFRPITKRALLIHFAVDPVGTELM